MSLIGRNDLIFLKLNACAQKFVLKIGNEAEKGPFFIMMMIYAKKGLSMAHFLGFEDKWLA